MKSLLILLLGITTTGSAAELKSAKHLRYQNTPGAPVIRQNLDVHYDAAALTKPKPVILWVHGGAWKFGNKTHSIQPKARTFVHAGYLLVAMNYRFHPHASWKDQANDVAAATQWVTRNISRFGGDPKKIILMGHSAGAHLAALTSADPTYLKKAGVPYSNIKATILLDGAGYDLPAVMRTSRGQHLKLYQEIFGNNPNELKAASPTHHYTKKRTAPDHLIIPIANRAITQQQSNNLAKAIRQTGNHAEVHTAKNRTHGSLNTRIGTKGDLPTQKILDFLGKRLP